ncbi:hypothetical protein LJR016_002075 [Devosia sp. LjRoot16]|uniref:hypothetical protein n=1 Tax=Devosia sp. LjRoot16 TaxID=3342271 RepID=UPI003ECE77EB
MDGAVAHSANVDGGVATERIDVVGRSGEHVVLLPGSAGAMRSVQGTLSNAFIQMIGDAYEDSVNEPMPDELLDELKGMAAQSSLATGSLIERVVRDDAYVFTVGAARVKTGGVEVDVLSTGYWAVLNESCVARGVFFVQPPMQPDAIVQEMSSILDELSS